MITLLENQDITTVQTDTIAHQVNCQGRMYSGVARAIRDKWPLVYNVYYAHWITMMQKENVKTSDWLGTIVPVMVHTDNGSPLIVYNLVAQDRFGYDGEKYTDIDALRKCLCELKRWLNIAAMTLGRTVSLAIPYKMGCDRGGADWDNEVYPILEELFGEEKNIEVKICKLN